MSTRDKRVDAYIARSQDFAKPILTHIRETIHEVCPDVQETIKWGMPSFDYKGPFISMAAFKQHATLGMWKSKLIFGPQGERDAMGNFGRITSVKDLPPKKTLIGYIKKAMALNDQGVKVSMRKKSGPATPLKVPPVLAAALKTNRKAQEAFDAFPTGQRNEYITWIGEAKTDETREKRLATAIEWIAEGKPRNWKYMRK
ncbi:MAG TPA: YdeI/OmpD-associated family protein [Vicinamibacterales bacterium]|nr:YdeI/OmpD-associated family protein [Vicinamibacterales bacterium]